MVETVIQYVLKRLKEIGVDDVFGVAGDYAFPVNDAIVEDPALWRNGWSAEAIRVAIHNFADQYGQAMLDAIKLIGGDK